MTLCGVSVGLWRVLVKSGVAILKGLLRAEKVPRRGVPGGAHNRNCGQAFRTAINLFSKKSYWVYSFSGGCLSNR